MAVKASPSVLRAAEKWRERAAVRMSELQKEHEALSGRLVETHLVFIARAGETGKLYGSITTADVVEKLNEELGTDVERRQIVGGPLRQLGDHKVTVRLSRDFQPQILVTIEQFEEEEPEEEVEEEALEAAVADAVVDEFEQEVLEDEVEDEVEDEDEVEAEEAEVEAVAEMAAEQAETEDSETEDSDAD
jgi:large subunit ribosomal protein L9